MKSTRRIASFLAVSLLVSIAAWAQPERVVAAAKGDGKLEAAQLVKLEAKGFVRHREEGLRYVYVPTATRASAQRSALRRLVQTFFEGSPGRTAGARAGHSIVAVTKPPSPVDRTSGSSRDRKRGEP